MTAKRISGGSSFTIEDAYQRSPLARWRSLPATARTCILFAIALVILIPYGLAMNAIDPPARPGENAGACYAATKVGQAAYAAYTGETGLSVQAATRLLYTEMNNRELTPLQQGNFRRAWLDVVSTGNLGSAGSSALATIASETC